MEQLNLFATEISEASIFAAIKASLLKIIIENNVSPDKLVLKEGESYSSVWYDSQLAFRICCRGKKHFFGISDVYKKHLPQEFECYIIKHRDGFINYAFGQMLNDALLFEPLLCACLDVAIDSLEKEFDCCSRYLECSNAKHCIQPNADLAEVCGYRRIMKAGKIYYGKNRNID